MRQVESEIEVDVPVRVAYDQWTQFEEFPRFMEGVEAVQQTTDTTLHWVAEVAGRRKEWDARITEQTPDQVIAWEGFGNPQNMGRVFFEPADGGSRTKISVAVGDKPEGAGGFVGGALGVGERRGKGRTGWMVEVIQP